MKKMKRLFLAAAVCCAAFSSATAQVMVDEKTTIYDLNSSRLHLFQTGDAMGDVSFIIEGDRSLVILEQPLFWDSIKEFNSYVESLNKPIDKVVANYHTLGLADYKSKSVVMPEGMITFMMGDNFKGMSAKFASAFGVAADMRPHKRASGFSVPSTQRWAGVEFKFMNGVKSDFPAASILIDGKAFYTHFAPAKSHLSPMQIKSREAVEFILTELREIKESGAEYIFGSHGAAATMDDVNFQIEYLETIKSLLATCADPDIFGQKLIVAYPTIPGAENIEAIARNLYPNYSLDSDKMAVKSRIQDYFNMVSNLDEEVAKDLWANSDNISIITPRSQFFGRESILNDFLKRTFSSMTYRKLSSFSEVINIYGDSANVQLYWKFDTKDAEGIPHQTRGRETLLFSKIDGEWRLVHVHYSRMPQ